ncbi:MAG: hypothetical protein UR73_C0037G0005 [candidate division WS6 bacterium GW2011_GWF1_35_23]|uniref:Uncharacterized protein n=1 Tax=candidate division WS6 bacterium GW2011_GWF1_35_23 TaxID=1619097 RepID=A0A0G0CFB4_9BACT|nr:MAG: hypothetical protein UR73_C0037G0005 [candidate division WS6 bacterium GW2011_GWF1_35_23]
MIDLTLFSIHWHLILGLVLGACLGMIVTSMCVAAGSADADFFRIALENEREERKQVEDAHLETRGKLNDAQKEVEYAKEKIHKRGKDAS